MDLYNLGKVSWQESQLLYHALAYSGSDALVLLSPSTPYVCIGFHQDAEAEVDLDFCQSNNIPVFKREVGGGAVYLDGNQFFFQLIMKQDNPLIPPNKEVFYQKFLQPVIDTYHQIGIPVEFKPVNDVLAGTRKISGTGVGEIGESVVFVGNLILDFNFEMMSRVLKVPDEKFRDKVHKTLEENLTTIRRELDLTEASKWNETNLNEILKSQFQKLLGEFQEKQIDDSLRSKMDEISSTMLGPDWLHQHGRKQSGRQVKIQTGVNIVQKMHKAVGGLIKATYELRDEMLFDVALSGDFFCYPSNAVDTLESKLEGIKVSDLQKTLDHFYSDQNVDTAGITVSDWMMVLNN
ncbi:MAG: lipoate--protein ligase family protein [Deltaproteobacteria bacterium]|jgi:lipoate---protein ligase|nr:lipoate--protein ligase family protein [Deltaproteobacteria bacterium]